MDSDVSGVGLADLRQQRRPASLSTQGKKLHPSPPRSVSWAQRRFVEPVGAAFTRFCPSTATVLSGSGRLSQGPRALLAPVRLCQFKISAGPAALTAGSVWPFTSSVHLAGSPGPLARESQQEVLESQRVGVSGQLGRFCAGGWQLASAFPHTYATVVARLQDHTMYI